VLVMGQTDNTENGIYDAATGAWSRSTDWNATDDVVIGQLVHVPNALYAASFTGTYTPDTTALTFLNYFGLSGRAPCVVASLSNITLSAAQTIHGTAVVADDRVLVAGQTDNTENGVYIVAAAAWARADDWNDLSLVVTGQTVFAGNPSVLYAASFTGTYTAGTTALTFDVVGDLAVVQTADASIADEQVFLQINDVPIGRYYGHGYVMFDMTSTGNAGVGPYIGMSGGLSIDSGSISSRYQQLIAAAHATAGTTWYLDGSKTNFNVAFVGQSLTITASPDYAYEFSGFFEVTAAGHIGLRFDNNGGTLNEIKENSCFMLTRLNR